VAGSAGHLRFAADILRRLGEELNPNIDQGIVELVKNAYDADATSCHVELVGTDAPGGSVRIEDDGEGMTEREVYDGWLVLGRSTKSTRGLTAKGRHPAGNKGLGRLAALRLGERAVLRTRPLSQPDREYEVWIEWAAYDGATLVEDVSIPIQNGPRASAHPGTSIEIEGLRDRVGRMEIKRLARALVLLADPFGDDPAGFNPTLGAEEYADLERLVSARYFPDAEYHLVAELDERGRAAVTVRDFRGEELFTADHAEFAQGRRYRAPPARLDFWVFLLSADVFRLRAASLREVREWLEQFGGVHLYVNGLRVAPYGNPGNDWLDLNLRRTQSPEERPSTNTSIGRLSVSDPNDRLMQKTDRSGLIEGEAFTELRDFAHDATEFLARRRMEVAERRRAREREQAGSRAGQQRQSLQDEIDRSGSKDRARLEPAFRRYDRARQLEADALRREVQLYRTLATAGITAATFAHESSGNPLKVIAHAVDAVERRARRATGQDSYADRIAEPVNAIRRAVDNLGVLSSATLRLLQADKRRATRVEVNEVVAQVLRTFDPFLRGRDVTVRVQYSPGTPYLRGSEAALESIVTNLLNNSLVAFERATSPDRRIDITTEIRGDLLLLVVSDNGPGIEGIGLEDIWLPGETTSVGGTGLGLAIVHDATSDLGGIARAVAHGPLAGAEFTIELPILGR